MCKNHSLFSLQIKSPRYLKARQWDIEDKSIIEWRTPDYLIPLMKEQAVRFGRTDVDESSILEKIKDRDTN